MISLLYPVSILCINELWQLNSFLCKMNRYCTAKTEQSKLLQNIAAFTAYCNFGTMLNVDIAATLIAPCHQVNGETHSLTMIP